MIRVLLFIALVALTAFGVVWFADRPGEVAIVWQGYRIETSVMVAVVAVAVVSLAAVLVWSIVRTILRSPDIFAMFLSHRRGVRGYLAISRGLVAVGAGDARAAKRASNEVERIAPGEPLALLLNAQVAQLSGDRAAAEHAFRAMAERSDTKLLGLRGLYIEAQRRNDPSSALLFAEEAAKHAPDMSWASQAVLDHRSATGDWAGARAAGGPTSSQVLSTSAVTATVMASRRYCGDQATRWSQGEDARSSACESNRTVRYTNSATRRATRPSWGMGNEP